MASSTLVNRKTIHKKPKSRSRGDVKRVLETTLREKFPHDTIDITDGFEGSIHVLVVSRVFSKLPERARYSYLWRIIERADFTEAEKDSITVVVGVSPRELM